MGETKLLRLILLGLCCQISGAGRISFPDDSSGSRPATTDRRSSSSSPSSSRQSEFEGRSIRGGSQSHLRPEYSRYNVYEHDQDDYPRPATTTTVKPYQRSTTRQVYNPNAYYNRLPPSKNDEPIQAEEEDDYDEEEDGVILGTDPPTSSEKPAADYVSGGYGARPVTFNNLFYGLHNDKFAGFGNLFGEDRRKHKYKFKRRRPGQPCIPYDFFNKLRNGRDSNGNRIDPKTLIPPLNLVLADVNYYSPNNNYNGHGGGSYASDTASDSSGSHGGAVFNNHFYDAVGGYPCTAGYQKPHKPHGGPLGFFGQGGLFDWTSSADNIQSDESGNKPTVVFNLNDAIDSVATNWRPGESFQMMMKVIAEFISSVAGGGGGGLPIADAGGAVVDAVDTVRKVNKEFVSLFT